MSEKRPISKPPFHRQETPDSCAVACLRSVLHFYGHVSDEASLRELCGTTSSGTLSDDLVKCARTLGFEAQKEYSNPELLHQHLAADRFPILYINLFFIDGIDSVHAVIATELQDQLILVIDPLEGERLLPLPAFERCWQMLNNLAIIVSPSQE
jgi:ABC-type bacteriocin/lantibiotic exporter with double-glycine peptidase domain